MKEIDFLPEWHKQARRRRMRYRAQYGLILCTFGVMCAWSFFNARSVSDAQAETARQKLTAEQMRDLQECAQLRTDLTSLEARVAALSKFDPKINFADVLAELSYLIDSKIILTELDIQSEPLNDAVPSRSGSGLTRIIKSQSAQDDYYRFKLVVRGMACDAGNIAGLICKLEQSPYFCRIVPGYSRSSKVKTRDISEFQVECYIANYKEAKQ